MNDNTKVVVALLAGLAAGAALGILFAPEKGTETRDKLSESLKQTLAIRSKKPRLPKLISWLA
jgi:gas vesicle protein